MPIKWTVSLFMMFLLLTVISGVMEMTYLTHEESSVFWDAMHPELGQGPGSSLPWGLGTVVGAITGFFAIVITWLRVLLKIVTFDYAMFTGPWLVVRFFFFCIAAGWIVSLVLAFKGTGSS